MSPTIQLSTTPLLLKRSAHLRAAVYWMLVFFENSNPGHYSTFGRLRRIFGFLYRSAKKRRQEKKEQKKEQKGEKKTNNKFKRRMLWRKLKVVFRALFFGKKKDLQNKMNAQVSRRKEWEKRRKRRIRKVILKSFFKPKKKSLVRQNSKLKRKQEALFQRYRRHRIYFFVVKRYLQLLGNFILGKGLPRKKKKKGTLLHLVFTHDYLVIALNSLVFFLLSYFLISFLEKLGMAFTAMHFDYKSVIYYYKLEYLVDNDDWYADAVKAIFASGPILMAIVATLLVILYSKIYLEDGLLKLLLLWGIFHAYNTFFGGSLIGALTGKEFGYVIMYMYYSDTGKLVIALFVILLMVVLGSASVKFWIFSANSYFNYSKTNNRPAFIISQVFIPYILGNLLIFIINQPKLIFYHVLVNLSLLFMLLPVLFLSRFHQEFYFDEKPKRINVSYLALIGTVLILAIYRIGLEYGLRLG